MLIENGRSHAFGYFSRGTMCFFCKMGRIDKGLSSIGAVAMYKWHAHLTPYFISTIRSALMEECTKQANHIKGRYN